MDQPGRELDLHGFRPADLQSILEEYLALAAQQGWSRVRIVHGRGRLVLARSVHSILARHPLVAAFSLATPQWGGPGATWVTLQSKKALGAPPHSPITNA